MISSTPKFQKKNIVITLLILLLVSCAIFFYRDLKPVTFVEGVIQNIFSVPKQSLYSLGKGSEIETPSSKKSFRPKSIPLAPVSGYFARTLNLGLNGVSTTE